ncbi:hypothetical protein EWM64_g514 [Hericium alpestre]|uniref:HMG box domain-containing protein n=1 Tax=Hericium alpestre TaxID=135208 RepID=A0A4Z0AAY4_9AGAM|nr:hypothetical protein EWM64_g514 [Hericium alpestre]
MALLSGSEEERTVEKVLRHLNIEDTPSPLLHALMPSIIPSPGASNPSSSPDRPTKKSHARRQPTGHIPRPRNAFILFRCDFVAQKKVPASVEHDHRNISRIAGRIWQGMGETERAPWVAMAAKEKEEHRRRYPGYRYSPVGEVGDANIRREKRKSGKAKAKQEYSEPWQIDAVLSRPDIPNREGVEHLDVDRVDRWGRPPREPALAPPRRSSSCPPPATVPQLDPLHYIASMPFVQDDMQRRPSRVFQELYPTSFSSDEGVPSWDAYPGSYQWSPAPEYYVSQYNFDVCHKLSAS